MAEASFSLAPLYQTENVRLAVNINAHSADYVLAEDKTVKVDDEKFNTIVTPLTQTLKLLSTVRNNKMTAYTQFTLS